MDQKYPADEIDEYCETIKSNYLEIRKIFNSLPLTDREIWDDNEVYGPILRGTNSLYDKMRFFSEYIKATREDLEELHLVESRGSIKGE